MTDVSARRAILITGASSGIGAATARACAQAGYDLCLHYNANLDGAREVSEACRAAGARAALVQADLSDPAQLAQMYAHCDTEFEKLYGLVNNAGQVDLPARVDEMGAARLRRMLTVNLISPILAAKEAVLRMSARHGGAGGVIINVTSAAARIGGANMYVDYAASKAGIDTLTKGLSDEVAQEGIRVCGLRPGVITTPIHAKGGAPERAVEMGANVPIGRPGRAEECADAIVFLLSDAASYITGTTLDVTGGR